jgi:ribosomal silencing factor RsfS
MAKDKKATEILNLELTEISAALAVVLPMLEGHQVYKILEEQRERVESARDALLTIQFHARQI